MSFNIQICAKRNAKVTVNGQTTTDVQSISFNQWQTPTDVTKSILNSDDKLQAYVDWVKRFWRDEKRVLDEEDKIWLDTDKDYLITNHAKEHLEELDKFIEEAKNGQYQIHIYGF